jgi:hypothetical protein
MPKTKERKKEILLELYDFEEILDILGFNDGSNEDVKTDKINELFDTWALLEKESDFKLFKDAIMEVAIVNGNFEEVLKKEYRLAL